MFLDKVTRGLFGGNRNERYTLVGRFEPNNLGLVLVAVIVVTAVATISGLPFGLLLLLRRLATGTKETKSSGEHLPGNTFDHSHDVTRVQRLLLVTDLIFLDQQEALAFHFDVVILLLRRSLTKTATTANAAVRSDFLAFSIGARVGASQFVVSAIVTRPGICDILALFLLFLLFLL